MISAVYQELEGEGDVPRSLCWHLAHERHSEAFVVVGSGVSSVASDGAGACVLHQGSHQAVAAGAVLVLGGACGLGVDAHVPGDRVGGGGLVGHHYDGVPLAHVHVQIGDQTGGVEVDPIGLDQAHGVACNREVERGEGRAIDDPQAVSLLRSEGKSSGRHTGARDRDICLLRTGAGVLASPVDQSRGPQRQHCGVGLPEAGSDVGRLVVVPVLQEDCVVVVVRREVGVARVVHYDKAAQAIDVLVLVVRVPPVGAH